MMKQMLFPFPVFSIEGIGRAFGGSSYAVFVATRKRRVSPQYTRAFGSIYSASSVSVY
jgi:hypothetical protein